MPSTWLIGSSKVMSLLYRLSVIFCNIIWSPSGSSALSLQPIRNIYGREPLSSRSTLSKKPEASESLGGFPCFYSATRGPHPSLKQALEVGLQERCHVPHHILDFWPSCQGLRCNGRHSPCALPLSHRHLQGTCELSCPRPPPPNSSSKGDACFEKASCCSSSPHGRARWR
jgi:hypothetical protein